jgi:hypothetical protein
VTGIEARAAAFVAQGGGCRATFTVYNRKLAEIGPAGEGVNSGMV